MMRNIPKLRGPIMHFSDDSLLPKIRLPFTVTARRRAPVSVILCLCFLISGCSTHYYKVSDPLTGKTYYTDDVEQKSGDGVELRDAATGGWVTIQNSEVTEINKYEFDTGRLRSDQRRESVTWP
jgi:hypothetical protein